MTTTSGCSSSQASIASAPPSNDPTTSTSSIRPSTSASVSRKRRLSSTRATRTACIRTSLERRSTEGSASLGSEPERVVRLAAVVHVELELGIGLAEPGDELLEGLRVLAGEQREHVTRTLEHAFDDRPGDLVEAVSAGDRRAVCQAEPGPLADDDAVGLHVAGGDGDRAGRKVERGTRHDLDVLVEAPGRVEGERGGKPRLERRRRDDR